MALSRKVLTTVGNYSIELVAQNANTYSIQILDLNDHTILANLPLDPMDNTLAAVIDKNTIAKLGAAAPAVLESLSKALQEQIGGKEFLVVPPGVDLPEYILAQNAGFKRLRQASRADLEKTTASILDEYKDLVRELDQTKEIIVGIASLTKKLPPQNPYEEILVFLAKHADFTPEKMIEYNQEDIQGKKARFNNHHVTTIAMLDQQQRLCGIVRGLFMGNEFMYLSDETVNQEILPLDKFQGDAKTRSKFLLAYLVNKVCALVKQNYLLIIAADKREDIYDGIGFQTFPMKSEDYVVRMKLAKPAPALADVKEKLLQPSSEMAVISKVGVMPSPLASAAGTVVVDQKLSI